MRKIHFLLPIAVSALACYGERASDRVRVAQYAPVQLTTDLNQLSEREREMIPHMIAAAEIMDELFWMQAYLGDREAVLAGASSEDERRYIEINYGPWDRLKGDEPFLPEAGAKAPGANFYPADMTREEFDSVVAASPAIGDGLRNLYTVVRRAPDGSLIPRPYKEEYAAQLETAARHLRAAAELAEDLGLRMYLQARADALVTDDYQQSDMLWLDMKSNRIDFVVGAIETYEDQLLGYKAAYEALVLVKDVEWSKRLSRYAALLPDLQRGLPVENEYKREMPGTDSELNAYDVIYYAGQANAGTKAIAVNLPNDEEVQLQKGTRRLQLKNTVRAKFDRILMPIADLLIADDQRSHVTFDAFFENTMFHEVAHGLGIKNTINGRGTVREALREHASAIEEGKADVLGLYMITTLRERGQMTGGDVRDNFVTFLASIFRSVRFGAASAHGRANMIRFNFFEEMGAFIRDESTGTYSVDFDRMKEAMTALSRRILTLQGDGDYENVSQLVSDMGTVPAGLQQDLDRLSTAGIPVDIVFEQGLEFLGLSSAVR